jgi:hypothetical protein
LLTTEPSTPVMNEGPISFGNVVGLGRSMAGADVDAVGASNAIATMGS